MHLSLRLMIAGGGTGGHVFPGIALAEAFLALCPGGFVSFVGTEAGLEARAVPARGFDIDFVPSGQVRGKGLGALPGIARMASGLRVAASVLPARRPDLVFGVGGYASVPVALAACARRVPLFLQEQNAVPGRSNRLLGRMARRVFVGFGGASRFFPAGRAIVTGNPVRKDLVDAASAHSGKAPGGIFTVLAMGGSQGARAINRRVIGMGRTAKREGIAIRFLLQTGEREFDEAEKTVREEGLAVEPFPFTDDVGEAYSRCHAVLMRAGALSVSEAALFGKPCVLVPYPYAADRHQERNAEELCAAGAGVWMREEEATEERLLRALRAFADDPSLSEAAGRAAAGFSRPDAASSIVRLALHDLGKGAARV